MAQSDQILTTPELKQLLGEVANEAASKAIKSYRDEERRLQNSENKDAQFNTRLLLKNYHRLVAHGEKAVCSERELEEEFSALEILSDHGEQARVESIMKSRRRTIIMVSHMQVCKQLLQDETELTEPAKWKSFDLYWFDKKMQSYNTGEKTRKIAEIVHATDRTIRSWIDEMVVEYSSILWGVDGLSDKNLYQDLVDKGIGKPKNSLPKVFQKSAL